MLRAKAGSEILAVHPTHANDHGRLPLFVTKTYGMGKVLFMGTDGAWRWREGVEDKYHYRFWGQVIRWMAYQRNMAGDDAMRFYYSPDRPGVGDTISLNANVVSPTGEPLQSGSVTVQLVAPSGRTKVVRLGSQSQEWGLFSGTFIPDESGDFQVTLRCRENDAALDTTVSVQNVNREQLGHPARYAVLDEITSITRGRMTSMADAEGIVAQIVQLPDAELTTRRARVWCHPFWVGLLVTLLVVFWSGRKMVGTA